MYVEKEERRIMFEKLKKDEKIFRRRIKKEEWSMKNEEGEYYCENEEEILLREEEGEY